MTRTREEAVAAIVSAVPALTPSDIDGFLACTDDERQLIIQSYRDAGVMPKASAWDVVLDILKTCAEVAALVIPITAAIQGVYGVGAL